MLKRETYDAVLNVRVLDKHKKLVEEFAEEHECAMSDVIRAALEKFFEEKLDK